LSTSRHNSWPNASGYAHWLMAATSSGTSAWPPSTPSSPGIAAHRQVGYTIDAIFVELSIQESVRRSDAMHRRGHDEYRRGRGYGGRYIPAEAIWALALPAVPAPGGTPQAQGASSGPAGGILGGPVPDDVTGMIRSYLAGALTLDAICQRYRSRRWPAVPTACPAGLETAAPAIDDPEPYIPGSFDDVVRAYDLGWITDPDYEAFAAAAAASPGRHPR
jgi:hypothetical protein